MKLDMRVFEGPPLITVTEQNSASRLPRSGNESTTFTVFVQYLDRWFRGCRFDTLEAATAEAVDSFRRSGLGVEVRDSSNRVRYQQAAGLTVDTEAELTLV